MTEFNPIIKALDDIDENIAAEAVRSTKKKMKKPLKIAIIAVAATLALGMTAFAATSGDNPIIKINKKVTPGFFSEYVDDNGWKIQTYGVTFPSEYSRYKPVGEIRAVFNKGAEMYELHYYDELGVHLYGVNGATNDTFFFCNAEKDGEIPFESFGTITLDPRTKYDITADTNNNIFITTWTDPAEVVKYNFDRENYERMSLEEKVYELYYSSDYAYFEKLEGIRIPPAEEVVTEIDYWTGRGYCNENNTPTEFLKHFEFTPHIGKGLSEQSGRVVAMLYADPDTEICDQGIYQYTLTDDETGAPIDFTAWHNADKRKCHTDHFDFEYEYVTLDSGAEARIHRSAKGSYIAEFEKDGAAYAFTTDLDRDNVMRILNNLV